MTALSEIAVLSTEIWYQCTLVTLEKELLERGYSHRNETHFAACTLCSLPGSDLQPTAGTGGAGEGRELTA